MNTDVPERLPTRPLRNWLLAWRIWTGDPPETIARGFDLDEELVVELLGPRPPLMMKSDDAIGVCQSLRLDPSSMWQSDQAQLASTGADPQLFDERFNAILTALDR